MQDSDGCCTSPYMRLISYWNVFDLERSIFEKIKISYFLHTKMCTFEVLFQNLTHFRYSAVLPTPLGVLKNALKRPWYMWDDCWRLLNKLQFWRGIEPWIPKKKDFDRKRWKKLFSLWGGSNCRPQACKTNALPLSYHVNILCGAQCIVQISMPKGTNNFKEFITQ